MIAWLLRLIALLLHAALMFAAAPLLMGLIDKLRARLLGRRGPPVLQHYVALKKLCRKNILIPDTATDFFTVWPYAAFAATSAAALLVPGFCTGLPTANLSDFINFIGLLAIARAATILAGFETGFGFGGSGAARQTLLTIFSEAALIIVILGFALMAHSSTIDAAASLLRTPQTGDAVSLSFAFLAMLAVALSDTGRLPAGQAELKMVHHAMALEYSGAPLAIFKYTAMLRLLVWMTLIGTLFCPFRLAIADNFLTWPGGVFMWAFKLAVFGGALSVFEAATAELRLFRAPAILGAATVFGFLSALFLILSGTNGG